MSEAICRRKEQIPGDLEHSQMRDTTWNVFAGGCGLVRGWYHKWWIVNSVNGNIFGRGVVGKIEESYVACLEVECDEASLLMGDSSLFKAQPLPPPHIDDDVDRQTQGQQVEHDEHDVKLRSNRNKVVVILDATEMLRKLLRNWYRLSGNGRRSGWGRF